MPSVRKLSDNASLEALGSGSAPILVPLLSVSIARTSLGRRFYKKIQGVRFRCTVYAVHERAIPPLICLLGYVIAFYYDSAG